MLPNNEYICQKGFISVPRTNADTLFAFFRDNHSILLCNLHNMECPYKTTCQMIMLQQIYYSGIIICVSCKNKIKYNEAYFVCDKHKNNKLCIDCITNKNDDELYPFVIEYISKKHSLTCYQKLQHSANVPVYGTNYCQKRRIQSLKKQSIGDVSAINQHINYNNNNTNCINNNVSEKSAAPPPPSQNL